MNLLANAALSLKGRQELAATHFVEHHARDGIVKQLTEGLEEGI
jgi:hypothetical protein